MSYVSKFEKQIPTAEIAVVIAAARGQATRREGVSAGLYALGCAAEFVPFDGTTPPLMAAHEDASDEDVATALEAHLHQTSAGSSGPVGAGVGAGGALITIMIPLIQLLLQRWLKAP